MTFAPSDRPSQRISTPGFEPTQGLTSRRSVTPRRGALIALTIASVAVAAVALTSHLASSSMILDPARESSRTEYLVVGLLLLALTVFVLARAPDSWRLPAVVTAGFFTLLALGLWAALAIQNYKQLGYPIAAFQPLPSASALRHVLLVDLAAGGSLIVGWFLVTITRGSRHLARASAPSSSRYGSSWNWDVVDRTMRGLFAIGLGGTLVLLAVTRHLAITSGNIDQTRYSQAAGLGFAALLQFCLVPAAGIGACMAVRRRGTRIRGSLYCLVSLGVLIATRVERTPLLLAFVMAVFLLRDYGRPLHVRYVALVAVALASGALLLGVFRLQSQTVALQPHEATVREVLDISPEVREQAFLYQLVPSSRPYLGLSAVPPLTLSVIPGKVLALTGVDKTTVYTDSSRQYTAMMNSLGIYTTDKPIRVGLVGELWMDAGWAGVLLGMFAFGALTTVLGSYRTRTDSSRILKGLMAAFAVSALVLPLATLAPIAWTCIVCLLLLRKQPSSISSISP